MTKRADSGKWSATPALQGKRMIMFLQRVASVRYFELEARLRRRAALSEGGRLWKRSSEVSGSVLNHRVQIDGTFENVDNAAKAPESRTPADDLVELRGTSIRQIAGECSAAK